MSKLLISTYIKFAQLGGFTVALNSNFRRWLGVLEYTISST